MQKNKIYDNYVIGFFPIPFISFFMVFFTSLIVYYYYLKTLDIILLIGFYSLLIIDTIWFLSQLIYICTLPFSYIFKNYYFKAMYMSIINNKKIYYNDIIKVIKRKRMFWGNERSSLFIIYDGNGLYIENCPLSVFREILMKVPLSKIEETDKEGLLSEIKDFKRTKK